MSDSTLSQPLVSDPPVFTDQQILFRLIRQEWRLCRGAVTGLAMLWVIGLWVLLIFSHPAWLLVIGLLHVVLVSPLQAGRDVVDGSEEFSFAQAPGRGPLYLARLTLGLVFLLVSGGFGGLAIDCNLPQHLWSLVFSGGLTEPFASQPEFLWYGLAVLVPTAAHGVTFALAANAGSRAGVPAAWLAGFPVAGIVTGAGLWLEGTLWQNPNGILTVPALLATTVLVPLAGYFAYLRKEATGSGGVAGRAGGSAWGWIVAVAIGLLMLLSLLFFVFTPRMNTSVQTERQHAEEAQRRALPPPAPSPERNSN